MELKIQIFDWNSTYLYWRILIGLILNTFIMYLWDSIPIQNEITKINSKFDDTSKLKV